MSMKYVQAVSAVSSCPEFARAAAKFRGQIEAKNDGMSMKYVQAVSAVSSCPEFARTAAKFPSGEVAA